MVGGFIMAHYRQYYGVGMMRGFLVRKEEKDGEIIEGNFCPGDNVVIFEDVVTTGTQVKRAVEVVESKGGIVRAIIAILDRKSGAKELLGPRFHSMMTIDDLGVRV
jgi:orotate phosphoribosyltransferase